MSCQPGRKHNTAPAAAHTRKGLGNANAEANVDYTVDCVSTCQRGYLGCVCRFSTWFACFVNVVDDISNQVDVWGGIVVILSFL